jgi:hypothetical protein
MEVVADAWLEQILPRAVRAATRAAIDALEREPFLRVIGGLLVENLPAQARLVTWQRDLREAREEVERWRDRMPPRRRLEC